jgi:hypothetical protein
MTARCVYELISVPDVGPRKANFRVLSSDLDRPDVLLDILYQLLDEIWFFASPNEKSYRRELPFDYAVSRILEQMDFDCSLREIQIRTMTALMEMVGSELIDSQRTYLILPA